MAGESFFQGLQAGIASGQERQKARLDAQFQQKALDQQLALKLAEAGINDPAVFAQLRQNVPQPQGPEDAVVGAADRLLGGIPGIGKITGGLAKASRGDPGAEAEQAAGGFAKLGGAFETARANQDARAVKRSQDTNFQRELVNALFPQLLNPDAAPGTTQAQGAATGTAQPTEEAAATGDTRLDALRESMGHKVLGLPRKSDLAKQADEQRKRDAVTIDAALTAKAGRGEELSPEEIETIDAARTIRGKPTFTQTQRKEGREKRKDAAAVEDRKARIENTKTDNFDKLDSRLTALNKEPESSSGRSSDDPTFIDDKRRTIIRMQRQANVEGRVLSDTIVLENPLSTAQGVAELLNLEPPEDSFFNFEFSDKAKAAGTKERDEETTRQMAVLDKARAANVLTDDNYTKAMTELYDQTPEFVAERLADIKSQQKPSDFTIPNADGDTLDDELDVAGGEEEEAATAPAASRKPQPIEISQIHALTAEMFPGKDISSLTPEEKAQVRARLNEMLAEQGQ